MLPKPAREGRAIGQRFHHHAVQPVERGGRNFARPGLWGEVGVGIAIVVRHLLGQMLAPALDQFGARGRAETDRIGHAIVAYRHAVVRKARRHIENVAGFEHPLVRRLEIGDQPQILVRQ